MGAQKSKTAPQDVVDTSNKRLATISQPARAQVMSTAQEMDEKAKQIAEISYKDYDYPFENLVFEGGGAKGQVYIGCLQVWEELQIKPKRVAGASAGALCAALTAVGFSAEEMRGVLEIDLDSVLMDHSCGFCSLLPNLIRNFGWNPGKRFLSTMGELLERKGYNADVTFKELYAKSGVELCVTAVNVNMLSVEYFHPKTTPRMPIRLAVRMSLSIPGIFEAVKLKNGLGQTDVYIDGGLVCNYPIHAFDGWWLSMKKEDSFLNRIQPLSKLRQLMDKKERFGKFNDKTLGFVVYSALEQDLMQTELDTIAGLDISDRPHGSKLFKSRSDALQYKEKALKEHEIFLRALDKFLKTLRGMNKNCDDHHVDDVIDKSELLKALRLAKTRNSSSSAQNEFSAHDVEILFGQEANIDNVFDELDVDGSGCISYDELVLFIERAGIDIQSKFQGYDRRELGNLGQYVIGLQDTLLTNVKKMFIEERDIDRTVGINTDYIETTDFAMEQVDREFCYERGRRATISFLRHYVDKHNPPRKVQSEPLHPKPNEGITGISTKLLAPPIGEAAALPLPTGRKDAAITLPPIRGKEASAADSQYPGHAVSYSETSHGHNTPVTVSAIRTESTSSCDSSAAPNENRLA
ncbi:uncharacterized protein [Watersipora subatra]|uniref:uncharacterized protein n=1 Tax=Watersipora subatra TaxID=2589382 RepID=UPI00355C1D9D